ncbi:leucine-rich repeat-containing protein 3B-like [Acanthochromis polyacanthus]|uniref:leucine-rich repeat-containing protein 3B-like n=1 Tax=Acanthochromis polyacanthus TaxID=80966 RepID=UPI002234CABF|nr:leucine-rich repeat-containing protein 3B-like [Acanthochromis polyacanthus]
MMSHSESPPSSSVVDVSSQWRLLLLLLILLLPGLVMTSSPRSVALWHRSNKLSNINVCHWSKMADGTLTVRCNGFRLTEVPVGLTNRTTRLFLNKNLISSLPADSFSDLFLLNELDLSHNQLSFLEVGCFNGLASSLRFLDLSSNQLSLLDPAVFDGLQVIATLTQNPWHCDCRMQLSMPRLDLDSASLAEVICQTSDLPNLGAVGLPMLLLMEDWDLCRSVRRTHDFLALVTMFLWFFMLISYLIYYIRENEAVAHQHLEYLKFLEILHPACN